MPYTWAAPRALAASYTPARLELITASGQVVPGGFLDPINNVLYGGTGSAGIKGGSGGGYLDEQEVLPENLTIDGTTYSGGLSVGLAQSEYKSTGGPSDKYGQRSGRTYGGYLQCWFSLSVTC